MGKAWELGAVAFVALGCSTTATITRRDGAELEGSIKGGTPYSVILETEQGRYEEIPRDGITEIDHPGNVHALIGGLFVGWSGVMFLEQSNVCDVNFSSDCWAPVVPAAVGAALMAWGLATWTSSKDAAGKSSLKPLHPRYDRPPPRGGSRPPDDELPPPPPAPPGYVGPGTTAPAPAPADPAAAPTPATPAPAPSAEPPAEPDAGGVVW